MTQFQWEVRNKPGDDKPSRIIEAEAVMLDEKKVAAIFYNTKTGDADAIVALTPGMTITKKK
jgi:hypothetical protein